MTGSSTQEFIEGLGFQYFRILSSSTQDPCCKRDLGGGHQYGLTFIAQKWYLSLGLIFPWKALTTWLLLGQEEWEAWKDPWKGICHPACTPYPGREQGTLRSGSNFAAGVNPLQHKGRRMKWHLGGNPPLQLPGNLASTVGGYRSVLKQIYKPSVTQLMGSKLLYYWTIAS